MLEEWFERNPISTTMVFIVLVALAAGIMYVFARMLIKSLNDSAKFEQPMTTLMLILGTISIVALIGALFTRDESAFTIAATGVGAFAGALTARSQAVLERDVTPPKTIPERLGLVETQPERSPDADEDPDVEDAGS